MNKVFSRVAILAVIAATASGCFIDRVTPGYAGVKVHNWGNDKGVDVEPLPVGRVIYNPITTDIYKFPTFVQHVTWDMYGGNDESLVINSTEGSTIEFDAAIAIKFTPDMVPAMFEEFRTTPTAIVNGYIRTQIEGYFNDKASTMPAVDIVGDGKVELQRYAFEQAQLLLAPKGIELEFVRIIGEMRMDEQVTRSINAVLTAAQQAIEARNRVAQAEAEADQKIARSRGDSLSMVIDAGGRAEANRLLAESLDNRLIEYEKILKWNGQLPTVQGSATPIIDLRP